MRFFYDIKQYRGYIVYAAKSRLKSEVSNAYFDWLWWILEPFGLMIVYSVVFGMLLGTYEDYFTIFIFLGNAMWGFFSKCITASVRMIKNNETTISKVYLPKTILVIVEMLVNAYKMLICFGIIAVMMLIYRVPITWRIILIIPICIIFFIFVYGCCVVVMHIGVFVADFSYVLGIVLNMLMYMSGIFYSFDNLTPPYGMILQNVNPVAFLLTSMRQALMYSQTPNMIIMVIWAIISIGIAVLGTKIIYKNENNYVKVI